MTEELAMAETEAIRPLTYSQPTQGWVCFHCGETFTTPGSASDHFGATPESTAGCLIDRVALEEGGKPERGRGLLMALRKAEARAETAEAQRQAQATDEQRVREHMAPWQLKTEAGEADGRHREERVNAM